MIYTSSLFYTLLKKPKEKVFRGKILDLNKKRVFSQRESRRRIKTPANRLH